MKITSERRQRRTFRSQDFKQTVNTEEKSSPLKGLSTSERAIMAEKERLEKAKEGEAKEGEPVGKSYEEVEKEIKLQPRLLLVYE